MKNYHHFLLLSVCTYNPVLVNSFSPVGWKARTNFRLWNDFVDVDFGPVMDDADDAPTKTTDEKIEVLKSNSLLDMTLKDNNVTFPFIDSVTLQTLNCRVAVTAVLDNDQLYAVGIPQQHGVLMIVERGGNSDDDNNDDATVEYLDPDDDENVEVLEIMAGALEKYLSPDLKLQRTPRILTIAGDLDQYTEDFSANLVSKQLTMENLLEEPDDDLDKLFDFFKEQLGQEQFDEAMEGAEDLVDPEFLSMFEMKDEFDPNTTPQELEQAFRELGEDLQHEGVGVKLVGFQVKGDDKKENTAPSFYSLVKPIKALTVVGRLKQDGQDTTFELLSQQEEVMIVPRLEQICQEDLEAQGIALDTPSKRP